MTTTVPLSTTKLVWNQETRKYDERLIYGTIRLDIDVQGIILVLGHKALVNKTGKAVDLGGLVKATRI